MLLNKMLSLALDAMLVLSPAGVQTPNPFVDCNSLMQAIELSGVEITVPDTIDGYAGCVFRANDEDDLIEVIYQSDDREICIRKAVGEAEISGNCIDHAETNTVDVDGTAVCMKGADGKVNLALWLANGYSFAIDSTEPMDKAAVTDLVKIVNDGKEAPIGGDPATWGPALQNDDGGTQAVSPFADCDSVDAADALAGFDVTLPKPADHLQVWQGYMIQAFYGENGSDMVIRKARDSADISGDYNAYAQCRTVDGVTLKGANDQFALAVWTDGAYAYSISVATALPQTELMALIAAVQ